MIKKITHKPPRFHQDNSLYFLTFCTYRREDYLHRGEVPRMLIDNLKHYGDRLKELIAFTIMPDHIHLLIDVENQATLSNFLRDFKKYTSKEIKRILSINTDHIWQHGTMDHCIRFSWGNEDFHKHLEYIFYNSWKHLKTAPKDFPYHNFTEIVERGWIDKDFCDFQESTLPVVDIYE
ncbi:MAG: transposase [Ignavibacteriae bacterium]|nr:transposase [Ignavibacteriota bacterium]